MHSRIPKARPGRHLQNSKWSVSGVRVCNSPSCLQIILPRRRTIIRRCIFSNRPACAAKEPLKHFSFRYRVRVPHPRRVFVFAARVGFHYTIRRNALTPYPGRFCGQLLCFDDFTAKCCLQVNENKYFMPQNTGGGGRSYGTSLCPQSKPWRRRGSGTRNADFQVILQAALV